MNTTYLKTDFSETGTAFAGKKTILHEMFAFFLSCKNGIFRLKI